MIINDNIEVGLYKDDSQWHDEKDWCSYDGHINIYDLDHSVVEDHLEKEWHQAVISLSHIYDLGPEDLTDPFDMQIGLHIVKERSNMDDILFTNPLLQKEEHRSMDMGDSDTQYMQQQAASLEPHVGQGTELLSWRPPPALNDIVKWYDSNYAVQGKYSRGWPHFSWLVP